MKDKNDAYNLHKHHQNTKDLSTIGHIQENPIYIQWQDWYNYISNQF